MRSSLQLKTELLKQKSSAVHSAHEKLSARASAAPSTPSTL